MRQNYRRENSSTGKAYRLLDSSLPIKPSFTVVAAAILIVFIVFAFTCFAAVTFEAASAQLAASDKAGKSCSQYYAAEAAAVDILTTLSSDDGNSLTDNSKIMVIELLTFRRHGTKECTSGKNQVFSL